MREAIKRLLNKLPYIRSLVLEKDRLIDAIDIIKETYQSWVPPGHYYSPIPSVEELKENRNKIYDPLKAIHAIDLNEDFQISLLNDFVKLYNDLDYSSRVNGRHRYFYNNPSFKEPDAIILYSIIRHTRPERIVEIGAGYTSALMIDINEKYFNNSIDITIIEPFPDLLLSLLKEKDKSTLKLISEKTQNVDLNIFNKLEAGDLLFIDSTHVSKTGSDVNVIFFEILPRIKPGVIIHFHDVVFPFEYPEEWVFNTNGNWKGFGWNECFLLRAFLMYNDSYKIFFFGSFLADKNREYFEKNMPLFLNSTPGSIYLQKTK